MTPYSQKSAAAYEEHGQGDATGRQTATQNMGDSDSTKVSKGRVAGVFARASRMPRR